MKKNIVKIFALSFALIMGSACGVHAQNFLSKPQAMKNLSDEAKHISATLPTLQENDETMYKVNKEKLRFIKNMLRALKGENTVQAAASAELPKSEWNVLQPSVRFINTSFSGQSRNKYIREEILFLITY